MATRSSECPLSFLRPPKADFKTPLSISVFHSLSNTKYSRSLVPRSSKPSSPPIEAASNDLQTFHLPSTTVQPSPFPRPDLISNELIQRLCKDSKDKALAFRHYQKARDQTNFRPDAKTWKFLIRVLLESKDWNSISALIKDFEVFNVLPDRPICARLVGGCIKARRFKLAESLLRILETRKGIIAVSAFGSAMHGYNKLHMYRSTVSAYERMTAAGLPLNPSCYRCAMDAYRSLGNTEKVLALIHEFESERRTSLATTIEVYSILCDSLARAGRASEALQYFREMEKKGIPPNTNIYVLLISHFAGIRETETAEDLFQEARDKGMLKGPDVFMKLVIMYVEVGLVEKTIWVAEAMREIGIRVSDSHLSAIVNGFAQKRGLRASVEAYEQLVSLGCEPGQVTYSSIINVYCRLGLPGKAETVFSEMMEKGFDRCVVAYATMISMYGKIGRPRDAMKLLARMKQKGCAPNIWVYNSLLDMHGRLMDLRQVERLWKEMQRRKIAPDRISYTSIIGAYSKGGELEECVRLYQEFKANGGKVDRALAGIIVGVFSKSSRPNELIKLLQDMKSEGTRLDRRLHESALNALRDAGLQVHVKWFQDNFDFEEDQT